MKRSLSNFKILALIFIIAFINTKGIAQQLSSSEIDKLVERTMETFDVPGIAVAIVKDGKVIHSKGYGVRSLKTMQNVDENTLFAIASNSKAFTAAALAILVDQGRVKWEDKVVDIVPEFQLYNPYVTSEFTIKDLLTHRSGLGLGAGDLMIWPDSNDFTIKDIIHNIRYLEPVSGFRTKYDYDNLLYIVAGEVVCRASGLCWEEFVEKNIMKPLEMRRSAGSYSRLIDKSNIIDAHVVLEGKAQAVEMTLNEVANAAGGIYSSISDMSKWVIMQMNAGKYGEGLSKRVFSEAASREMWSPQTIIQVRNAGAYNTHFSSYGLGWGLSDVNGYKQVSHTGGLTGVVTQVTLIPEIQLGIIVFTNQQSGAAFTSITNTIKDSYFGIRNVDRVKENYDKIKDGEESAAAVTDSIWRRVENMKNTEIDLKLYIGKYSDKWFGDVFITKVNGHLWFQSKRSPRLSGQMLYYTGNTFVVRWSDRSLEADAFVKFELDYNGEPSGMKMKAISPLTDFSYDFQDLNFFRK